MNVQIDYTINEIAKICEGKWKNNHDSNALLEYLSLDTRKISYPEVTVFFAIKNPLRNANLFLETIYKKGVCNFVTDDNSIDIALFPQANIILVNDTIFALQKLAVYNRNRFSKNKLTVLGITGSNGKTIVKEWLNQLLENDFSIVRSPKSYNSQIGVPLSVLNISSKNDLAIFEAGISKPGEMKNLEKIIKPHIGIFTNIGNAHDEGFKNKEQKIREKLLLFKYSDHLVFCSDDEKLFEEIELFQQKNKQLQLFSWGRKKSSILQIKEIKKISSSSLIQAVYHQEKVQIEIPFIDDASIQNAIHCWCVLFILNKNISQEINRFNSLYAVEMRLELKKGINRCNLINDSYSNDFYSLSIALDFLNQQKQHKIHSLIFSEIIQSGVAPEKLYADIASILQQKKIDKFFGIGPDILSHQKLFKDLKNTAFFKTTDEFLKNILLSNFHDETILIKGARHFQFEKITHLLEQKIHQTVLSINLNSVAYNLKQYREKLKPETKIMAMVKAFGYGSGSYEIASVLEYNKVDYLAVAYTDEAIELRNAGITLPIMVMNTDKSVFDSLVNYNLEPEIFSFSLLKDFSEYLEKSGLKNYPVHLKIDTGMHRLGFIENEMDSLCKIILGNHSIKIKSVFSHFAASEDENEDIFTLQQFNIFKSCCVKIENILDYYFDTHIDNTSGVSRHPEFQLSMVRLGIGLYGIDSNKEMQKNLKNVSTLSTTISQVKKIKAGETVGYGRKARLQKDSLIAIVRIGYADGYSRRLGNGVGKMMVKNKLFPIIGNICMDMCMLDVTNINDVNEGDEATVFGESLSLQKLAEWAGTIPYEILTGISQRVKRIYFEE